jgi:(2R)-sulfolactate sulfo-lyase subunit alpha
MMIHFVLHDARDTVAVVVVEGVRRGQTLKGWIMDEDRMTEVVAKADIPIGHKVALRDMAVGDTVWKYGIDMGKVVVAITAGEHAHVHNIKTKRW